MEHYHRNFRTGSVSSCSWSAYDPEQFERPPNLAVGFGQEAHSALIRMIGSVFDVATQGC
jgi:hypothetical protein